MNIGKRKIAAALTVAIVVAFLVLTEYGQGFVDGFKDGWSGTPPRTATSD